VRYAEKTMKPEYNEGPEALKRFNQGMKKLFQAKKEPPAPKPESAKQKETSKD